MLMPPQSISSKRRDAKVDLDPITLRRHPQLAVRIADVIAYWSRIESLLGSILGRMLGSQARPSIAMYEAIRSSQIQMYVLEAAANAALSPENLEVFNPLLVAVKHAGAARHKIAHWLWADSPDFPNSLILVNPDAITDFEKKVSDDTASLERGEVPTRYPELDLRFAFIWETADFNDLIDELDDVYHLTLRFSALVTHGGKVSVPEDSQLRATLLNAPRIQEVLRRKGGSNPES